MTDTAVIQAIDLTKRYTDGTLAVDALNLDVGAGEIYCLLGPNGSGKTTALNLFLDFARPTSGRALIAGVDCNRHPRQAKQHLAYLMENAAFYGNLTVRQNLAFFARLGGRSGLRRRDIEMALREAGLPERSFDQRVGDFPKVMRQKLGVAIASVRDAPALLLDEPLSGLDPQAAGELIVAFRSLRDRGRAILLTTHDLFHAKQLADTVGILKEGRQVMACSRDDLRYRDLEALYLEA